jgi:hypothetical protein
MNLQPADSTTLIMPWKEMFSTEKAIRDLAKFEESFGMVNAGEE